MSEPKIEKIESKEIDVEKVEPITLTGIHYLIEDITGWSTKETTRRASLWWFRSTPHAVVTDIEGRERRIPQNVNPQVLGQDDRFISAHPEEFG